MSRKLIRPSERCSEFSDCEENVDEEIELFYWGID